MGFQRSTGYEKMKTGNAARKNVAKPRRCRWLRIMKGRFKGFRVTNARRLNWKTFSMVVMLKRISGMYEAVVKRMVTDGAYPAMVLSCQWGFPVLSYCNR